MEKLLVMSNFSFSQSVSKRLTIYSAETHFNTSTTGFKNIVGKGEIAHDKQFLFFPCFLLKQIIVSPFVHSFDTTSLFAAELEKPTVGISGNRLSLCFNDMYSICIILKRQ